MLGSNFIVNAQVSLKEETGLLPIGIRRINTILPLNVLICSEKGSVLKEKKINKRNMLQLSAKSCLLE